ncbi:MAG: tRNA1(Val) (adenine(37)-N6)-methyltransferase [Deltaproteobacteria bacterium]|nr:tRNA1(Val) (adenine(37)-N6)-methyltransferase [Deltaproteobacteria bacterium]
MNEKISYEHLKKTGETVDDILRGRLKILQKEKGYRFSLDSILLAHFIRLKRNNRVVDLGTGSGIIAMILTYRFDLQGVIAVDVQAELVDMARRSIRLNGLESRIDIQQGDVRDVRNFLDPQSFDMAVFNPPYRKLDSGRINPDGERAVARHEIMGSIADFLSSAKYLLKDTGGVFLIYPARRSAELIYQMRLNSIEPKQIRMVHSDSSSRAEFILAEGVKRGGEELTVMPPLFIYHEKGTYSQEMEEIFREISYPAATVDL